MEVDMEQTIDNNLVTRHMRCCYMNDLLDTIRNISSLDYQQRIWVDNADPNIFDNWEETMCRFFDDADIDNFLGDLTPYTNLAYGLNQHHINALWKLRYKMRQYSDATPRTMNPEDVLDDLRWHEVVACAQETLDVFKGYEIPRNKSEKI